ncbi:cytochrome c oxidase subunit 4 [Streptomyces endophytica]|uniref:cytochrome-c oxidase n=1 Tax=Streptomyces endophytica TaxID=2991496 RepID=A0ABY6PG02_9ACTN|nr:cytochrome c oxidase subunit 4 [Streptomyces endophytica]UZJ32805.1 cytochrome c oxidase subunit 4 [Streptomyces endophytica]
MKAEAYLFAGVALFFLLTDAVYIWFAREPAGIAALTVSCFMAVVISFFCVVNYRRKGERPEDRQESEIHERSGPLDFFPPHSGYPIVVALGVALSGLGLVYAVWLLLIGLGVTVSAIFGMVFEFARRDD